MSKIGLASLIDPQPTADFFEEAWPFEPFVVHDLKESVAELTSLPFLQSLDAMLGSWPHSVQAHLPDVNDESSAVDVTPADARKLFANRMGLLFNRVQRTSPVLQNWLKALGKDLGLPTSTYARCIVYATPDGKGTAAHFDQNINFVLQIHGTKKWTIAPNTSVHNPTERHTLGQPIAPEILSYAHAEMPEVMPGADRREFILKPGSLLFVPRGYWHSTEAEGEALALNFTFSQPTWVDVFLLALRSRLSLSPEWRELADGVTAADVDRRQAATVRLDLLLEELKEDLPHWRAEDILSATEGDQN